MKKKGENPEEKLKKISHLTDEKPENTNKKELFGVFLSPREKNQRETMRYWSPNPVKLRSNEYFLAKRHQKIRNEDKKDQKKRENTVENVENCNNIEINEEINEEKIEENNEFIDKNEENYRVFSAKNMMKFKPILKGKDQDSPQKTMIYTKENTEKNKGFLIKNTKEIAEKDHKIMKQTTKISFKNPKSPLIPLVFISNFSENSQKTRK